MTRPLCIYHGGCDDGFAVGLLSERTRHLNLFSSVCFFLVAILKIFILKISS